MFDCCSKTYSRVDANLDLTRAFALVGLLRLVDDSVPRDLIYIYLKNTDQSGLYYCICEKLFSRNDCCYPGNPAAEAVWDTEHRHVDAATCEIPTGLSRMAKEYFVRCYWDQVAYLMNRVISFTDNEGANQFVEQERMYPAYVRTALDVLDIPYHAELKMIRHRVNAFYASIMPTGGNVGEGIPEWSSKTFPGDYNVLSISQIRKIQALRTLACQFVRAQIGAYTIPDVVDREAFCNLLDVLLVLCGSSSRGFQETRQLKQVYEYSKMISTLDIGGCRGKFPRSALMMKQHYIYNTKVDKAAETMSNMTPQAVLCIGKDDRFLCEINNPKAFYSLSPSRHAPADSGFREFLHKINPRPAIETRLYIVKELAVERHKLRELVSKKGRDKSNGDCSCNEPVVACYC